YNQPLYKSETSISMRKTTCPVAEQACREVIFIEQNLLLADSHKIELIAEAVKKIRKNASQLHTIKIEESEFIGSSVLKKAAKNN
ncbi:MAG: hypothetical protein KAU83_07100, partial [Bacteroidales bacterium]|nr:hypothetical protein [Bacteroidales bacterium]